MANAMMSLSSALPTNQTLPEPEFVDTTIPPICVNCEHTLRPPVFQTECGHRLCAKCADSLFQSNEHVMCPGKEEDCVKLTPAKRLPVWQRKVRLKTQPCTLLCRDKFPVSKCQAEQTLEKPLIITYSGVSHNKVLPDRATSRELLRKSVFCPNKKHGCTETMKWIEQLAHEQECQWRKIPCTNQGCDKMLFVADLESHVNESCEFGTELCENCEEMVTKKHIRNGHAKECATHPGKCHYEGFGCTFVGDSAELQKHGISDFAKHTKYTISAIKDIKTDNGSLDTQCQDIRQEMTRMQTTIDALSTDSKNKHQIQALQKSVAKLSVEFNSLKSRIDECASKESISKCSTDIQNVKEIASSHESRLAHLESGSGTGNPHIPRDLVEKMDRIERSVGMHDVRMAESDLRFRLLETAAFDGRLIWRIPFYARRKMDAIEGRTLSLYSQPFYTSYYGYKMCARMYPNGDGLGKGSHLSLFFVLMRGEYDALLVWPFRQKVTLSILDQSGNRKHITDTFRPDPTSTSFRRPVGEMNIASGSPMFAPHSKVESVPYLKDDTMFICITVDKTDLAEPWPW